VTPNSANNGYNLVGLTESGTVQVTTFGWLRVANQRNDCRFVHEQTTIGPLGFGAGEVPNVDALRCKPPFCLVATTLKDK
jgi:hypothetical protein